MLMKLLVSAFERAKSKITSTRSIGRISSGLFKAFLTKSIQLKFFPIRHLQTSSFFYSLDSDNEFDSKQISSSGPFIIHQQPRLSLSKWLCTNPSSVEKSVSEKENDLFFTLHVIRNIYSNNLQPAVCILRLQI
jgi:hypothetical protein